MSRPNVSIAMAVYNGEKYIRQQLDSILVQLNSKDEVVISYDASQDKTLSIINEYANRDNRVKVYINNNHKYGLESNFENALRQCKGEIIFFSDQDDVWLENKIETVLDGFKDESVTAVIHDSKLVDSDLNTIYESTFKLRNGNTSLVKNLIRLSYIGCCMAFRSTMLKVILPIRLNKRAHDWWTGSICSCYGRMEMINEPLILHRIHDNNATPKKRPSFSYQLSVRIKIILLLIVRKIKCIKI